jgi:hypothetical protein
MAASVGIARRRTEEEGAKAFFLCERRRRRRIQGAMREQLQKNAAWLSPSTPGPSYRRGAERN